MTAATPGALSGHGFTVQPTRGWEGRIYRRVRPVAPDTPQNRAAAVGAGGWLGEQPLPILHLADFALPAVRGDFGSGAVEMMRRTNIFLALLQFGDECLGSALYSRQGRPRVEKSRFSPNGLQRILPGQAGAQYFFTEQNRPMCLYVVIGSTHSIGSMSTRVNDVLDLVSVDA